MMDQLDTHFIHDISQLDKIRQQAKNGANSDDALKAVATQFEALFTQMLFKSMRDANSAFETDLINNRTTKLFQQLSDEQLSSSLAKEGSLGLANLIVEQFKGLHQAKPMDIANNKLSNKNLIVDKNTIQNTPAIQVENKTTLPDFLANKQSQPILPAKTPALKKFISPTDFVATLFPLANKAAKSLGVDPAVLLAQAAVETGWGEKILNNAKMHSHNLFNIKADPSWQGEKVVKQSLEFYDDIAVKQKAAFRSYDSYQASFDDYVQFLNDNPRYANALKVANNANEFIEQLQQAGYATDPNYSQKISSVFKQVKQML